MPTTSAFDPRGAERLSSRLVRLRARWLAARFLRLVGPSLASSFAAAIVWAHVHGSSGTLGLASSAFTAGLALALAVAGWRRPSLLTLAKEVDRRARLDQRLETSLELLGESDPTSSLVLEDTLARIAKLRGEDVFPLRLAPDKRAMGGALALLTGALLVVVSGFESTRRGGSPVALRDSESSNADVRNDVPERPGPGASAPSTEIDVREMNVSEPGHAAAKGGDPHRLPMPPEDEPSQPVPAGASLPEVTASEELDSGPVAAFERVEPFQLMERPASDVRASDRIGESDAGDRGRFRGARASGLAGPATRGEASSVPGEASAGGEGTGSASTAAADDSPLASSPTRFESPLPRDGIPPALAEYVRAYFDWIRSPR